MLAFYIILEADGQLKHHRLYTRYNAAEKGANQEGDSVVRVEVSHEQAPLFIRRKTVE